MAFAGASVHAQTDGQFVFRTFDATALTQHLVFNTDMTSPAQGPNIVGRIWVNTSGTTPAIGPNMTPGDPFTANGWTAAGTGGAPFLMGLASGAGFIDAGITSAAGTSPGDTVWYSLAAWDNTTGAAFGDASVRNYSTPVQIALGGTPAVGAPITPLNVNTFDSFSLQVVPEPSTVALGVIGGLALLMRRRK